MKTLYKEGNPGPLKAALNFVGIPVGSVSVPLVDASSTVEAELKNKLTELLVPVR